MTTKSAQKNSRNNSTCGDSLTTPARGISRTTSVHRNSRTTPVQGITQTTAVPTKLRIKPVHLALLRRFADDVLLAGLLEIRGTRQIYVMSPKEETKHQEDIKTVPADESTVHEDGSLPAGKDIPPAQYVNKEDLFAASHQIADAANCDPGNSDGNEVFFTLTPSAGSKMAQVIDNTSVENRGVCPGSGGGSSEATRPMGAGPAECFVVERKFKIQFAVDPAFMEKLSKIKSLLLTKYPRIITFEMVFDILMSEYLDRHSPEEKIERRNARKKRRENKKFSKDNPGARNKKSSGDERNARKITKRTRHITQAVRDEVFKRDGGRCTFVGNDGKRCESDWNLQIDHIVPFARGGDNSPENLRLLYAEHNQLQAERVFGKNHMKKFKRRE